MHQKSTVAYIGLGSNLASQMGSSSELLSYAAYAIHALPHTQILQSSSIYHSAALEGAWGAPDFLNAAVKIRTQLSAPKLLQQLQTIEKNAGRTRPYHHAPRTLDLDILLYGNETHHTTNLQLPHPRMWQRAFVLRPLSEINPALVSNQQLQAVAGQKCQIASHKCSNQQNL